MDEDVTEREHLLRRDYHQQTARIHWHELQTYYAGGSVIRVVSGLNLVEVAVQLGLDNTACFQRWIENGDVAAVSDEQALIWYEGNAELWAVVAAPWVLVQQPGDANLTE
ncbi:MAG: DUF2288 domain-containing protein [Halioglobus sp.]|nr:DUF2288 domain-containing protein [Halioglobus sp.]